MKDELIKYAEIVNKMKSINELDEFADRIYNDINIDSELKMAIYGMLAIKSIQLKSE